MRQRLPVAVAIAALAAGCWSYRPERLEVLVATAPPGASCVLARGGQPVATVDPTPAIALIDPRGPDIAVHCRRAGFADADAVLPAGRRTYGDDETRIEITLPPAAPVALLPPR